jgi:glycerophosphoryl diester phosphodiesterase
MHTPRSTLCIAHRGARAFAPENTLEAIEKAAALGADMVEVDVQLTADGRLVVVHDDTLERCSNVAQVFPSRAHDPVGSFTLEEVQQLDAGSWFVRAIEVQKGVGYRCAKHPSGRPGNDTRPLFEPSFLFLASLSPAEMREFISPSDLGHYRSGNVRHPTLEQVLARCAGLGLGVNIELKTCGDNGGPLAEAVARLLSGSSVETSRVEKQPVPNPSTLRTPHSAPLLVSSFDHDSLRRFHQLQPNVPIGVLVTQTLADPVGYCRSLGAAAYHPSCASDAGCVGFDSEHYRQTGRLPAEPFRSLREAGLAVNVWTENDPTRMQRLIDAGATGIFTDYPSRLAALR